MRSEVLSADVRLGDASLAHTVPACHLIAWRPQVAAAYEVSGTIDLDGACVCRLYTCKFTALVQGRV